MNHPSNRIWPTKVETPGNDAIDKIRAGGSLTEEDRMHLTYYIATMIRKGAESEERAHEMMLDILEVADDTMEWLRQSAEAGQMDDDTLKKKLAEADAAVEKFRVTVRCLY